MRAHDARHGALPDRGAQDVEGGVAELGDFLVRAEGVEGAPQEHRRPLPQGQDLLDAVAADAHGVMDHDALGLDDAQAPAGRAGEVREPDQGVLPRDRAVAGGGAPGEDQGGLGPAEPAQRAEQVRRRRRDPQARLGGLQCHVQAHLGYLVVVQRGQGMVGQGAGGDEHPPVGVQRVEGDLGADAAVAVGGQRRAPRAGEQAPRHAARGDGLGLGRLAAERHDSPFADGNLLPRQG